MPDALVARQPIFDRRLDVVGYELLFRSGIVDSAEITDPEGATATVVLNSLTEIGVERLVGAGSAWINVSREFLLDGFAQLLPPRLFVLEILESQRIDAELLAAVGELAATGYTFALDDFVYEDAEPLLAAARFAKLDLVRSGRERFARETRRLHAQGLAVVAEKVESYEDQEFCTDLGCELFQGRFFCHPQLVRSGRLDANRLSVLRLLGALQQRDVELHELERDITSDPRLSYRLLRYINSAFVGVGSEVRSIGQAVTLLGIENLKRWAALSLFTMIEDKPSELTRTALSRARFCELAAGELGEEVSSELFMIGLLSVIDALLDLPLADALAQMPLPADIVAAITRRAGPRGAPLEAVTALESGNVVTAQRLVADADRLYLEALLWTDSAADVLVAA